MLERIVALRRLSVERGVLEGRLAWLGLAALLWGARALRLALRRETGLAWRGELREGEALIIEAARPARR